MSEPLAFGEIRRILPKAPSASSSVPLSDLEDVESWLHHVYRLLCLEPDRSWMSAVQVLKSQRPFRMEASDNDRSVESIRGGLKGSASAVTSAEAVSVVHRGAIRVTEKDDDTLNPVILMHPSDYEIWRICENQVLCDLDYILSQLMDISNELDTKIEYAKEAIGHASCALDSHGDALKPLQAWLDFHNGLLDPLRNRLDYRISQMKFEKIQKAIFDDVNIAQNYVEFIMNDTQHHSESHETEEHVMRAEQYRLKLEAQIKDLEAVIKQLVLFGHADTLALDHILQQLQKVHFNTFFRFPGRLVPTADTSIDCEIYFRIPILIGLFSLICTIVVIFLHSIANSTQ